MRGPNELLILGRASLAERDPERAIKPGEARRRHVFGGTVKDRGYSERRFVQRIRIERSRLGEAYCTVMEMGEVVVKALMPLPVVAVMVKE